jgi:hypothetical protein
MLWFNMLLFTLSTTSLFDSLDQMRLGKFLEQFKDLEGVG